MKVPNIEQAIIPERKLTQYLLSPTHRTGRGKATFFGDFGFTRESWQTLAEAVRKHAVEHELTGAEGTPFGTR